MTNHGGRGGKLQSRKLNNTIWAKNREGGNIAHWHSFNSLFRFRSYDVNISLSKFKELDNYSSFFHFLCFYLSIFLSIFQSVMIIIIYFRASKKIILPDPSVRSVMIKYLEKGEMSFDKIFNQRLGYLLFKVNVNINCVW